MSVELKRTILAQQDTIRTQQRVLNGLAEMLGVAEGDVDGLITRVERLKKDAERYQWLRDPCSGAERVVLYSRGDFGRGLLSYTMLDDAIDAEIGKALAGGEAENV